MFEVSDAFYVISGEKTWKYYIKITKCDLIFVCIAPLGRFSMSTDRLAGSFGHHHSLAALFVDGILFFWCCLFMRDAHPCKLAFCLVWSLGFTGVCSSVCACVERHVLNLMLRSYRTPARARGPWRSFCRATGRKRGSPLMTRSKQGKVGLLS